MRTKSRELVDKENDKEMESRPKELSPNTARRASWFAGFFGTTSANASTDINCPSKATAATSDLKKGGQKLQEYQPLAATTDDVPMQPPPKPTPSPVRTEDIARMARRTGELAPSPSSPVQRNLGGITQDDTTFAPAPRLQNEKMGSANQFLQTQSEQRTPSKRLVNHAHRQHEFKMRQQQKEIQEQQHEKQL